MVHARSPASPPSGLLALVFTDVQGSTPLWERDAETARQAMRLHDELLRLLITEHGGYEVKTEGDSFMVAFGSADQAAHWCCEAQARLLGLDWPAELLAQSEAIVVEEDSRLLFRGLRVRMGIHLGEPNCQVHPETGAMDYVGPVVNLAARISSAAHGGQILLGEAVHAVLGADRGGQMEDLGSFRLKGITEPKRLWELKPDELARRRFPAPRATKLRKTNLREPATRFIGRENLLEKLRKRLVDGTRLLTLTGAGGCGKTRLAMRLAEELLEEYEDGVWLVDFAALTDQALVSQSVATVFGLREQPGKSFEEIIGDFFERKSLLLILDNCEHLLESCAELSASLLEVARGLRIVATSREVLGVAGESVYPVPPLALPAPGETSASVALSSEAVGLFIERARDIRPNFQLHENNTLFVVRVCHRLDGIPLAIELAATRVQTLSVEQIGVRLDDCFGLLTSGSRRALPRHRTLRATIDWSHELLTKKERWLFRRLSLFEGGWTLDGAEQVCAGDCLEGSEVLDVLSHLVDKSLVVVEGRGGAPRYRFLVQVQQYAKERLVESNEVDRIASRHLDFYLALAEEAMPKLTGAERALWIERLAAEHENLRSALNRVDATSEKGLRLAAALGGFWVAHGYYAEGRAHLARLLSNNEDASRSTVRATALGECGNLACLQGDFAEARELHRESLAINREAGAKPGIARGLHLLGNVAIRQGECAEARSLYAESLAIERELDNKRGISLSLFNLGRVAQSQAEHTTAKSLFQESLSIERELDNKMGIAACLANLGIVKEYMGEYTAARSLLEESLAIQREFGNRHGIALCLGNLASVASSLGDHAAACKLQEESLGIHRELGDTYGIAVSLTYLGSFYYEMSQLVSARASLREGLSIGRQLGARPLISFSLGYLAICAASSFSTLAARLFGAAENMRVGFGPPLTSAEQSIHDRTVAAVRDALGEKVFTAAWAEGEAMSPDQAIDLALADESDRLS